MFECKVITSEAEYESLAGEWRQLQASASPSPFTDYIWFDAWWRHLGKPGGRKLHIVTARDSGRLMGVLPLVTRRRRGLSLLQGAGLEAFYLSGAVASSPACAGALWDAARRSRLYDFAMIRDVDVESLSSHALAGFARKGDIEAAPFIAVQWKSGEEWFASLPRKVQHEHRRHTRRMEEKGAIELCLHTEGAPPEDVLRAMIRHKADWCAKNGKSGFFDQAGVMDFFRRVTQDAAANGALLLGWIRSGGEILSGNFGVMHKEVFYDYLTTYDPAWMNLSPGNILMVNVIKKAIDMGCREFNLLQGESRYKRHLTNATRDYAEWVFGGSLLGGLKGRGYLAARTMRRKLKS